MVLADIITKELPTTIKIYLTTWPVMTTTAAIRPFHLWRCIQGGPTLIVLMTVVDEADILDNVNHVGAHLKNVIINRQGIG